LTSSIRKATSLDDTNTELINLKSSTSIVLASPTRNQPPSRKVAVLTLARITVLLPIIKLAVVTKVTSEAVAIISFVVAPVNAVLSVPTLETLLVAVLTLPSTTVVLPITISTPLTKVTPEPALITTLTIPTPVKAVFKVPVTIPCVTVTPALSVIACEVIANLHTFCDTATPIFSVMVCDAIPIVHSAPPPLLNIMSPSAPFVSVVVPV